MEIKTVSLIGLGALGVLFGDHLSTRMQKGNLKVIADKERIKRYERDHVYSNGKRCEFKFIEPEQDSSPADLILIAVKFNSLNDAIKAIKNHVGDKTVILSLLNGISSESIIGKAYGMDKVLDCVAQGMDAVKVGNRLTYDHMGKLCFGDREKGAVSEKTKAVAEFFDKMELPYEIDTNMKKRMWGKFMLNVGVNQIVAVYEGGYGVIQKEGQARDTMISAMREVIALSEKEEVYLTEDDLKYWLNILNNLNPEGEPSLRQDLKAKRMSEVELFSGTVLSLGRKYGIETPVNKKLYDKIKEMEKRWS